MRGTYKVLNVLRRAQKNIHEQNCLLFNRPRHLSSDTDSKSRNTKPNVSSWRRDELEGVAQKFNDTKTGPQVDNKIRSDDELQQMWREMESRVTRRRRPMSLGEASMKGKAIGRKNIRPTDEEVWLNAGLYSNAKNDNNESMK